jgi:chromosome segregation ATPase
MTDRVATGPALMEQLLQISAALAEIGERTRRTEAKIDALLAHRHTDTAKLDSATKALRSLRTTVHETSRAAVELATGSAELDG